MDGWSRVECFHGYDWEGGLSMVFWMTYFDGHLVGWLVCWFVGWFVGWLVCWLVESRLIWACVKLLCEHI